MREGMKHHIRMSDTHSHRELQNLGPLPTPSQWKKMQKMEVKGEYKGIVIWCGNIDFFPAVAGEGKPESHQHTFHVKDM